MNSNITTPQSKPSALAVPPTNKLSDFARSSSLKRSDNLSDNKVDINISEPPSINNEANSRYSQSASADISTASASKTGTFFKNIGWLKWGSVIIIFAFLGINIFSALGDATSGFTEILKPIASVFGYSLGETTKQTVKMSAKGTKEVVDIAAGAVESGVNVLEKGLSGNNQTNVVDNNRATTQKVLDGAKKQTRVPPSMPEADDAGSRTQQSRGSGKTGFCYIGEDRGFRSCIKVNEDDKCMSGQIFPTKDVCINPNLRA